MYLNNLKNSNSFNIFLIFTDKQGFKEQEKKWIIIFTLL